MDLDLDDRSEIVQGFRQNDHDTFSTTPNLTDSRFCEILR